MGYSRDGLENRLNTAYFELDKKIEIALEGSTLAESARQDFQEVRKKRLEQGKDTIPRYCRIDLCISLSACLYSFVSLSLPTCLKSIILG